MVWELQKKKFSLIQRKTRLQIIIFLQISKNQIQQAAGDGVLDANMKQLEKEPYRRADAVSRSFRRRQTARTENVKKGASTML